MPTFMVRVELIDVKLRTDYEALHEEMAADGFSRVLASAAGTNYKLPHAEYNIKTDADGGAVRAMALDAVRRVAERGRVVVTRVHSRWWANLERADD